MKIFSLCYPQTLFQGSNQKITDFKMIKHKNALFQVSNIIYFVKVNVVLTQ